MEGKDVLQVPCPPESAGGCVGFLRINTNKKTPLPEVPSQTREQKEVYTLQAGSWFTHFLAPHSVSVIN